MHLSSCNPRASSKETWIKANPLAEGKREVALVPSKDRQQSLPSILENPFDIFAHKQSLNQPTTRSGILDKVSRERASISLFESMFVNPAPVRTAALFVDKPNGRLPNRDFRSPSNWKSPHSQSIINDCAWLHDDRTRRGDAKFQPIRRYQLEVLCISEKREHLACRFRQPELTTIRAHAIRIFWPAPSDVVESSMSKLLTPNISGWGRVVRALWGLALVAAAFLISSVPTWLSVVLVGAGGFALFEAVQGWCVVRACGIKTRI